MGAPLASFDAFDPRVTVLRNGAYVDVTGEVTWTTVKLPVIRTSVDCQGNATGTTQDLDLYWLYGVVPKGGRTDRARIWLGQRHRGREAGRVRRAHRAGARVQEHAAVHAPPARRRARR